jgi:formate dehydrogenase major subunit
VNPLRGQNNVQGSCDMGSFPHELPGYRHVSDDACARCSRRCGRQAQKSRACAFPTCSTRRSTAVQGPLHPGRGHRCSPIPTPSTSPRRSTAMECVIVQDLFLNETAKYAHVFLPGSTFLEKDGTFTNAERRIKRVRKVMPPRNGLCRLGDHQLLANAMGYPMHYAHPSEIMDEIARLTPTFAGVSFEARRARQRSSGPATSGARGHADHAHRRLRARQGQVHGHRIRADRRAHNRASR